MKMLHRVRYRWQDAASSVAVQLVLLLFLLLTLMPVLWAFSTSIKPLKEVYIYPPNLLPSALMLENFAKAWTGAPFARYAVNSVLVTVSIMAGQMINASLAAYVFSRLSFKGRNLLFLLFLGSMMIPTQVLAVPSFLIFKVLGWINTYMALIVPFLANAFGIFLIRQSFLSVPQDLVDAAKVDGAGHLRIIGHVLVPMSRPAFLSFALLTFTWRWNDYFWPLIMTNSTAMRTLPVGLVFLRTSEGSVEWNVVMAAAVFVMAPIVLLFVLLQRYFVEGVISSGVKG
jgi:ABC-type glycerol-3-phosphate transport system permease component